MSDCAVKWIKVSTSMFDDEKIRYIEQLREADSILIILVKLLILAGKKNAGGEVYLTDEIHYTEEMLAAIWHREVDTVRLALQTFCKLKMIEIKADGTIIICNWGKHQSLDGLEKIKFLAAERQKRHRLKQTKQALLARGIPIPHNVTDYVTEGDVSRESALLSRSKNKIKNKSTEQKERISLSKGDTEVNSQPSEPDTTVLRRDTTASGDLIQRAEAKRLFGELSARVFGKELRENQWSSLMEHQLNEFLPMKRKDWELIAWFYGLPEDHEIFTITFRRQSIEALIENLSREVQKIRTARKRLGLNELNKKPAAATDEWTRERSAAFEKLFPGCDPGPFYLLDREMRERIDEKVKEEREIDKRAG